MSRTWTPEEIQLVSEKMKKAGHMGFEEFCEELERQGFEKLPCQQVTSKLPANKKCPHRAANYGDPVGDFFYSV